MDFPCFVMWYEVVCFLSPSLTLKLLRTCQINKTAYSVHVSKSEETASQLRPPVKLPSLIPGWDARSILDQQPVMVCNKPSSPRTNRISILHPLCSSNMAKAICVKITHVKFSPQDHPGWKSAALDLCMIWQVLRTSYCIPPCTNLEVPVATGDHVNTRVIHV
jgi:hypothetical protein